MEPLHRQDLITAQQLAALRLHRFYYAASGTTPSTPRDGKATMSDPGAVTDTRDGRVVALAWALAETAQSCAYLAEELQIAAGNSSVQTLTCHEWTYRRLLDSIEIFRALLDTMRAKYRDTNEKGLPSALPVLNARMAEETRSMLAHGSAITTVECMTSSERVETSSTETAGDTR